MRINLLFTYVATIGDTVAPINQLPITVEQYSVRFSLQIPTQSPALIS